MQLWMRQYDASGQALVGSRADDPPAVIEHVDVEWAWPPANARPATGRALQFFDKY